MRVIIIFIGVFLSSVVFSYDKFDLMVCDAITDLSSRNDCISTLNKKGKLEQWIDKKRIKNDLKGRYSEATKKIPDVKKIVKYDLKGDRLGMSLNEFKIKHHRKITTHNEDAPWCSDKNGKGREKFYGLLTDVYYTDAGLINCRLSFPFEAYDNFGAKEKYTVAGVSTNSLLYRFIDNRLFKIIIEFPHYGFFDIKQGLLKKQGKYSLLKTNVYQNRMGAKFTGEIIIWKNGVSTILLTEREGNLDISSLYYWDDTLVDVAAKRTPEKESDL